ncbi:MAG: hypothetical protein ACREHG_09525 [Candidatus Saccharimonadales bacterium]
MLNYKDDPEQLFFCSQEELKAEKQISFTLGFLIGAISMIVASAIVAFIAV